MHGVNLTNCRGLVVLVCVRTQGVPSVATRVVAKIYSNYRPIFFI